VKIISLLWGYSLGGIGKVANTYGKLHEISTIKVRTVVVQPQSVEVDLSSLNTLDSKIVSIISRFDISWVKRVKHEISIYNPDVLFVHGFNGPIIGLIQKIMFFKKLPLVCSYHGLYHPTTTFRKVLAPFFNFVPILIYKKYADKIITVEKHSKGVLVFKGVSQNKIDVVYNGLPEIKSQQRLDLEEWGLSVDDFVIGCASRIDPVKGITFLIDAFHELYKIHGNKFKLVIIGEGTVKEELQKKVNNLNLSKSIIFTGYQNNINDWLNLFDVFALPSLAEYHSIGLLEAMRSKKSIVATNVGGNTESIRNLKEGIIVDSKSSKQLFDAINKLYLDRNLSMQLANNAQLRFNKNFSEKASMNKLVEIFLKLKQ
jgi:glycosyltransferase involved in cell wall biosynthesis